jgi:CRISPR-associated endonuclease Csn1
MNEQNPQAGSARQTIWSFDLGKASLGEAVRYKDDDSFPHAESLLIPELFAETQSAASRRRMWRTRIAHHAREDWLAGIVRLAGFEPLRGRRMERCDGKWQMAEETPEERKRRAMLEREFPAKGDETQYNSAALRILLLEGKAKLEEWQIYKALRSAIQKRGYGRVPWSNREEKRGGKSEEEMEKERAKQDPGYLAALDAWKNFKEQTPSEFHSPCYYDAMHMKLWNAADPGVVKLRVDHKAESTRRVRFDREDVNKEIARLAEAAAAAWPALRGAFERIRADGWRYTESATGRERTLPVVAETLGEFLVHGPAGAPSAEALGDFHRYLEERRARGIRPGTEDDWQAATGQKTPRFDNRIVEPCALLDGLRVCNVAVRLDPKTEAAQPDSLLYAEVTFLMKLKNMRVQSREGQPALSVEEIRHILEAVRADVRGVASDAKDYGKKVAACYSLTKADWGKHKQIKPLALRPMAGQEEIKPPKTEGRSRFSRPALKLIRALVLSGQKPSVFHARLLAREKALLDDLGLDVLDTPPVRKVDGATVYVKQARPWILVKHLKFLEDLAGESDTWDKIHLPEQRLDALEARHTADGYLDREAAVRELIGSINDPIVRHRLGVFTDRLRDLEKEFGTPEQIVLEFVREDFMGAKAKGELFKFQNEREKKRKDAREKAAAAGASGKMAGLKFELYEAQGCACLYCGHNFEYTDLDDYRIEHIVPRAQNGPDAVVNYVLAHEKCNDDKGDKTPYQWLHGRDGWDAYVKRVTACGTALRNKKVQLLTREDAHELVQRYTALAETAWISRLAQKIAGLWFGWRNGNDNAGDKRVVVIAGGLTARIRRRYRLNSLLNPPPADCTDPAAWEETAEKNRDDDRHHALDAMVISFLPQWTRNAKKEHFFRFPAAIHANARAFFEQRLAAVTPRRIVRERAAMEETFYGKRQLLGQAFMVKRRPLFDLATKEEKGKVKIKPRKDIKTRKIVDGAVRRVVEEFLETQDELTLEVWSAFCAQARCGANGPRIVQMLMTETEPDAVDEYGDFAKAGEAARGQYRRAASHAGYFILTRHAPTAKEPEKKKIEVRPVFAFQSERDVRAQLCSEPGVVIVDYFWSNCQVLIRQEWEFKGEVYPAGEYTLKTVWAQGNAVLKHGGHGMIGAKPKHNAPIPLRMLVDAGIRRAKAQ